MSAKLFAALFVILAANATATVGSPSCAPMTPAASLPSTTMEIMNPIFASTMPCPEIDGCPINCHTAGEIGSVDTGETKCDQSGSGVFHCPHGQTIHVITLSCAHNPCCFQSPACLCPLNCGTAQSWECR